MEFNEEKAKEIVSKFNLDEKTIRVWRTRNKIPDRYADDQFQLRATLSKPAVVKHNRAVDAITSKYINLNSFAEIAAVPAHRIYDASSSAKKQVYLSEQDLHKVQVELKKLRLDIVKAFESYSPLHLKRLLKHPALAYSVIVAEKRLKDAVSAVRLDKCEADKQLWQDVKDAYMIVALKISI